MPIWQIVFVYFMLLSMGCGWTSPSESSEQGTGGLASHATSADLDELLVGLKSRDAVIRGRAVAGLSFLGPAAAPAIPQLIKALSDPSLEVRMGAAFALGKIGPAASEAIPHLRKLENQSTVGETVRKAIQNIESPAQEEIQ